MFDVRCSMFDILPFGQTNIEHSTSNIEC